MGERFGVVAASTSRAFHRPRSMERRRQEDDAAVKLTV